VKALEVLLGYGCNEKCLFCSQEVSWRRRPGLPFSLVAEQLYRAREDGFRSVCFTGGEPTLRPDLPKMAALARKLGFTYSRVQTNGVKLAEPAYAAELVAAGVNFFRVSLHGHTAKLHDELVLVPGALAKAYRGIGNLQRLGVGIGINVVLNKRNFRELPALCEEFLDRKFANLVLIYPLFEGDMVAHEAEMSAPMSEMAPYVRAAFKIFEKRAQPLPRLLNFTPCAAPELAPWMLSWSAHSAFVVDGNGKPVDLYMASHDDRVKVEACSRCRLNEECLGFKRNYGARFPDERLDAVRTVAADAALGDTNDTRVLARPKRATGRPSALDLIARAVFPVPESGGDSPLKVERIDVFLDEASLCIEEKRSQWELTHA